MAGLCSGSVQRHLCSPQKNLLSRSQQCQTKEVKSIASPKWEVDPRENSSPSGHSVSKSELRVQISWSLICWELCTPCSEVFFHQKLIGDFYHFPDSLSYPELGALKNHRKHISLRILLVISSCTAPSWCYFSKRKSMAWLWECLVTDRHCDIPGNLWIPLWKLCLSQL